MEAFITIFNQIVKMFVMMLVGYVLYKHHTINDDTTSKLSSILLMIATPATLITSFNQTFSIEKLKGLIVSFVLSILIYSLFILIAQGIFHKDQCNEKFGIVFSNAGFIGIPLVTGLLGIEGVFYLSPYIVSFYLFVWTYGVFIMSNDKQEVTIKKSITNPCIWAVVFGIVVFLLPVKPYAPIMEAISSLGGLNTPLAMIVLGAYLAKSNLLNLVKNVRIYKIVLIRLIVLPCIIMLLMKAIPETYASIRMTLFIAASAPTGSLLPVFASMYHRDTEFGSGIVSISTLLSLFTLPTLILLSQFVW